MTDQLNDFSKEVYNEAKLARLAGVLFLVIGLTVLLSLHYFGVEVSGGVSATLVSVSVAGILLVVLGDRWIRKIKKYTGVDVPLI